MPWVDVVDVPYLSIQKSQCVVQMEGLVKIPFKIYIHDFDNM